MRALDAGSIAARAVACASLLASAVVYTRLPFSADHGLYSYGAWRIAAGEVPYRDVGCYDAPGIYAVHGLAHGLFGWSERALRELDVLWMGGALVLLYAVARRLGGRLAGWLAVVVAAYVYLGLGDRETAQRDSFTVLFLLASLLLGLRPASLCSSIGLGALAAAVFWLKPPMVLIAAPVLAARLWPGAVIGIRGALRHAAALGAGFAAASAPVAILLAATRATDPFVECFVDYTRLYASVRYSVVAQLEVLVRTVVLTPVGVLALVGFAGWVRAPGLWLVKLGTLAALASVLVQGKLLVSHMVPLWILLSLGAALAIARAFTADLGANARARGVARVAAAAALVLVAVQIGELHREAGHPQLVLGAWRSGSLRIEREDAKVARYLFAHTHPDDNILVWGVGSGAVYFLAKRPAPTRFLQTYAFTSPFRNEPLIQRWRSEYLAALERDPPRYFVVMGNDAFPGVWNIDSEEGLREWTDLQRWLDAHYSVETQLGGRYRWKLLRRND